MLAQAKATYLSLIQFWSWLTLVKSFTPSHEREDNLALQFVQRPGGPGLYRTSVATEVRIRVHPLSGHDALCGCSHQT